MCISWTIKCLNFTSLKIHIFVSLLYFIIYKVLVSSPNRPGQLCDTPIFLFNGFLSPELKRLEREFDHSSPSLEEVKNEYSSTCVHPARLNTLRTGDADLRFYITTVQDR